MRRTQRRGIDGSPVLTGFAWMSCFSGSGVAVGVEGVFGVDVVGVGDEGVGVGVFGVGVGVSGVGVGVDSGVFTVTV